MSLGSALRLGHQNSVRHSLEHVHVRHVAEHVLGHMLEHALRHVPRHVLRHVPRHVPTSPTHSHPQGYWPPNFRPRAASNWASSYSQAEAEC